MSRIIGKPSPLPIMLGDGYKIISERDRVSDVFVVSLFWFPSSFCLLSENGYGPNGTLYISLSICFQNSSNMSILPLSL